MERRGFFFAMAEARSFNKMLLQDRQLNESQAITVKNARERLKNFCERQKSREKRLKIDR